MRRNLVIVGALLRASLLIGLQYRSSFLLDGFTGLIRTVARIAPLLVLFGHHPAVAGWTASGSSMVLALFMLMQAVLQGVIEPNLGAVVDDVRTGRFDLVLLRPADSQLLVSLRSIAPGQLWDLLSALALGGWAIANGPLPSGADVAVAALMLLCGLVSMYGLWLLAICTAFLVFRVDNLRYLLSAVTDAGRWPLDVYTGWVRWLFTVALPVSVFTSFPAIALRGDWDARLVTTGLGVALLFGVGSRFAWRASLARYTSASS